MTSLKQLLDASRSRLTPVYGGSEASWLLRIIMEHIKGWNQVELLMRADKEVSDFTVTRVNEVIDRLLANEPIQYIFGDTYWHGMTLKVSPAVLIPRPETEELVDIITKDNPQPDLKVLDVCTGSGCIAVALAKFMNFPEVTAIDISDRAIAVAKENAALQKVKVDFQTADALDLGAALTAKYDIIVSNPPYVMDKEKSAMDANVLDHEPAIALFVPDSDPLKFYKAIADYAADALTDGGRLYFELNPLTADSLKDWMQQSGWRDVSLLPDLHAKTRFMIARK
ncbi:peptide chain release factor N(5)-glutamine methyltransferase [Duncaniella sp.]|uniref:peptide chain release factor N(5)-glutamine methyltransferase n=1 Tax=Duncaniella sp. TaxID=2518496 RepID=UPI0023CB71B7|nr:peptide chain release factor N(5)-glutamine methyltransferase [Duncaniella sp.]MDE5904504.1 peptide chain release factor N(5)-glutamine methyltransferase [Duncaniella sp.]